MNKQIKEELEAYYRQEKNCTYTDDIQIGKKLKYLRECMNISQSELARRVNMDRSTIIRYENNLTIPRLKTLEKLLTALYADVRMFIKEDYHEDKTKDEDYYYEDEEYDANGNVIRKSKGKFQSKTRRHFDKLAKNNIFELRKEIDERIDKCLLYKYKGENVLIPNEVLDFIKVNVAAAFKVLDTLPHDKE